MSLLEYCETESRCLWLLRSYRLPIACPTQSVLTGKAASPERYLRLARLPLTLQQGDGDEQGFCALTSVLCGYFGA